MKIKYLADENLRQAIVLGVKRREPSIDFLQSAEAGLKGKSDLEVLEIAAREDRIRVSHDLRTLPNHFKEFIARRSSPGVFLVPQNITSIGAIEELIIMWAASDALEWKNRINFLPL